MTARTLRAWLGVLRLWSLTASTVPVLAGAALAACHGRLSGRLLALTLASGWLLQTATNLLNTYGDHRAGVDTRARPPTAPQLVDGSLRPRQVAGAGILLLAAGAGLGAAAAALSDWRLLLFAAAGVAGAAGYTTGVRYKYLGLGVPLVALLMGVLMVTASYFAQTGSLTGSSLLVSLPVACQVAAVLHGNDLRDLSTDRAAGIRTTSLLVGETAARRLFYALHLLPYAILALGCAARALPAGALLALLALPLSARAVATAAAAFRDGDAARVARLEGLSAGVHFVFGLLLAGGLFAAAAA